MSIDLDTLARKCIESCRAIARFSESEENTTRTYLAPCTSDAHEFLRNWMAALGMESRVDAVGNVRGIHRGQGKERQRLLVGSHIDTVPNAGAYDGVLGVVLALALIEALDGHRLGYEIEVIAFSEEEGVRFGVPFIGSRALVGSIDDALLLQQDERGITLAASIQQFGLDPLEIPQAALHSASFAYVEFHIEQGPVLDELHTSLGIVEAIAGQSRHELIFQGEANHAGTTPMRMRHDALTGAAEWILAVEREAASVAGLVATAGRIVAAPGAPNVIPGEVLVSLDIRHADDSIRRAAAERLVALAREIAGIRGLRLLPSLQYEKGATPMNADLAAALESAAIATGVTPHRMSSGAGHDAMVLAGALPAAMLFLRSPKGLSHHPQESVRLEDVRAALEAGLYFFKHLDPAAIAAPTTLRDYERP